MEFKTKLHNESISCYGVPKYLELHKDIEISDIIASATVKWGVEIAAMLWGIKDISCFFQSVEAEIEFQYYSEDDVECNNLLTKTFEIHSNDFTIVDEMKIKDNVLYPSNIEIDLERKKITIE